MQAYDNQRVNRKRGKRAGRPFQELNRRSARRCRELKIVRYWDSGGTIAYYPGKSLILKCILEPTQDKHQPWPLCLRRLPPIRWGCSHFRRAMERTVVCLPQLHDIQLRCRGFFQWYATRQFFCFWRHHFGVGCQTFCVPYTSVILPF